MWRFIVSVVVAGVGAVALSGCAAQQAPDVAAGMSGGPVGMTPEEIAEALSGPPQEVLVSPVWARLGVDPSDYDFLDDEEIHKYALDDVRFIRENPEHFHEFVPPDVSGSMLEYLVTTRREGSALRCVVAHTDFDNGGEADAFVLVHQGWGAHWLVLSQPSQGEWHCFGMVGQLIVEGWSRPNPDQPSHPDLNRMGGRTFLTVENGAYIGWIVPDASIEKLIYLIDEEGMTLLWREVLPTYGMVIEFEDRGGDGVEMVVRREAGYDWRGRTEPVPPSRRYLLAPGGTELELVETVEADAAER